MGPIQIEVYSNYGSDLILKNPDTTLELVRETMNNLNWKDFQIVNLSKSENDWISLSGNISDEGLACVFEENNIEFIIDSPLNTVEEMIEILISYYYGDGAFKKKYKISKFRQDTIKQEDVNPIEYKKWKEEFFNRRKKEKIADLKKTGNSILITVFISIVAYNLYIGELQFIGQNTEITQATVINTQMYPVGRGYYKQLVTYEFIFEGEIYRGTFKAGRSIGKQQVGNIIKVKFSTSNANRSLMVGFY